MYRAISLRYAYRQDGRGVSLLHCHTCLLARHHRHHSIPGSALCPQLQRAPQPGPSCSAPGSLEGLRCEQAAGAGQADEGGGAHAAHHIQKRPLCLG